MKLKNFQNPKEELDFLVEQIKFHNQKYYLDDSPEISDSEFDLLNKRLYDLLNQYPELKENFYEIELLGAKSNFPEDKKKPHLKQMLSLQNLFDFEDLTDFDKRIHRFLGAIDQAKFEYCLEQKFDGLSFSALFVDCEFKVALTRGDGFIGEDITSNIKILPNWPLKLEIKNNPNFKLPKKIEIRGEVFMPIKQFEELNKKLEENGEKKFVNPRNAASGSLRILDSDQMKKRGLKYFAYSIGYVEWSDEENKPKTQEELILFLKELGFETSDFLKKSNDLSEIYKIYLDALKSRESLKYEIDGLVIKINNLELQEKLGQTGKYPRSAAAFKFPSNEGFSRLLDVSFSVGRTGSITPVGHIKPVKLGGALISNSSLHNFDEIERLDLMINDIILVKRSGDVIPQIVSVLKEKRNLDDEKANFERFQISKPEFCPSCSSKLHKTEDEVILRCENFFCKSRLIEYIKYFCSRDAFNIVGLGDKQINHFFEKKFIENPVDIFFLEEKFGKEIRNLPNWGDKSSSNLFLNIEKARNVSFEKFIYALGIRFVGQTNSKLIAKFFKNQENFIEFIEKFDSEDFIKNMNSNEILSQLYEVDGLGEKAISSLILFLKNDNLRLFVKKLINVLKIDNSFDDFNQINQKIKDKNNIFFEKNIVFTGTLKSMSRQAAKEIITKQFGGNVQSSLTKTTNFLILGEDAGSKLQKALLFKDLKIINEQEFLKILENLNINF